MIKLTTKKTSDIFSNYSLIKNSVSVILFANGAQLLKSKAGTIWAIIVVQLGYYYFQYLLRRY
jgi:hypothetical protein